MFRAKGGLLFFLVWFLGLWGLGFAGFGVYGSQEFRFLGFSL